MTSWAATDVVHRVAGYGLPGAAPALPPDVLDDETWETVLTAVVHDRVTGHLVQALYDGAFSATEHQHAAAIAAHERVLALALVLERLLLRTIAYLNEANITTRVLKGPAIAHAVYPEPGLRSFGDIDLLVPKRDYDAALTWLCARGARRRDPQGLAEAFNRRFGKGVTLEVPGGLEIDLHRMFVAGPFGLAVDTNALFRSSTKFSLGGYEIEGLDPEARFRHACFHAALGDAQPGLVALRDVAQMTLCSTLDASRVRDLCREWRCGIVVQRATRLSWDTFEVDSTPEVVQWARVYEPTRFERQALLGYVGVDRSHARQAVAGLQAIRGFRAKVSYAATLLVPTRPYAWTGDSSYLRRAGRVLRLFLADRSERRRHASGA